MFDITADSKPVYGWLWTYITGKYWSAQDWINWHGLMVIKFGEDEANRRFVEAFNAAGFGNANYDWTASNPAFIAYTKDHGIYDAITPGLFGAGNKLIGSGVTTVGNVADAVTSLSTWIVPIVLVVVGFWIYKELFKK